jgi:spermidine synthase/MFS family permease
MIRPIALILTLLTGVSGLVYQVAWQKYLAILLGSQSEAVAAVLAIFLGGLAAGYALFGRVTRRFVEAARSRGEPARLLRLYGVVESGIGVYALLFPFGFGLVQALSVRLPHVGEAFNFSADVLLTVLLIGPPTLLMGGTIPVLTQALAARLDEATRVHAWVYAFNTAGAFFGALLGAFVLIPWLGLDGVVRCMGLVNLAAGLTFIALERSAQPASGPLPPLEPDAKPKRFAGYASVVLLSGFAMMCIQTALNRIGAISLGASHFTFAMVVAVFVLCIALGSFAVSALRTIPPLLIAGSQWLLVGLLALLYFELDNAPYYAHVLRALFASVPEGFYPYHFLVFLAILLCLCVPIGLSGALLPLVFHHLRDELGGVGGVAGRLYAWNTLGSLLGALLGGYALLFFVDLQQVYAIALAALVIAASLLSVLVLRLPVLAAVAASGAVLAVGWWLPDWRPLRLSSGLFRLREATPETFHGPDALFASRVTGLGVPFYDDDPTASVAATNAAGSLSIVTNGKPDGNLKYDYTTMSLAGLVPALLAEKLERVFVIGWGLGVTAGELGALEEVDEIVAVEISPGVLEAAPLFGAGNLDASRNPKIQRVRSDAYRALLRSEGQFDLIASEPSNPWVMGVEMLYSEDFLRVARDRLTPGGVYAQWFHLYEVDRATVRIILRTYKAVFGDLAVWYARGTDMLLLGFKEPSHALDLERTRQRFERPDFRAGFARAGVDSWIQLLAHELVPLGAIAATPMPGPLHSVRHPILSDSAARAFFAGRSTEVPLHPSREASEAAARGSLLARSLAGAEASEAVLEELTSHSCAMARPSECAVLAARWSVSHPDSARRIEFMRDLRSTDFTGTVTSPVSPKLVDALAALFRGQPVHDAKSAGPVRDAIATAELYASSFNFVFPFDRRALKRAFAKCAGNPATASSCMQAKRESETKVGAID